MQAVTPTPPRLDPKPPDAPAESPTGPRAGARLGRASSVYALCGVANKAVGFVLLPVYTQYLTKAEFGTVTIVVLISAFLSVLYTMALGAAVMRYYHEYRHEPERLAAFSGTVMSFIALVSLAMTAALALGGEVLLRPFLDDVPFYPYMMLGLGVALCQPIIDAYLVFLQAAERAKPYAVLVIGSVLIKTLLAIAFVVGVGFKAGGVLGAHVIATTIIFALVVVWLFREVKFGLQREHLRTAFRYALPLWPHTLSTQSRQLVDRMFLANLVSLGAVGVYHIGFQFGMLTHLVAASVGRAYQPLAIRAMKDNDIPRLDNLRNLGLSLVVGYTLVAAAISLFSPEVVQFLAGPDYHDAYLVVPLLSFSNVGVGIYQLLANALMMRPQTTKYMSLCTFFSLGLSVVLALILIPRFGMLGAAAGAMVTQILYSVAVGWFAHTRTGMTWPYGRIAAMFALGLLVACWVMAPWHEVSLVGVGQKIGLLAALFCSLNVIAYGSPFFLVRELRGTLAKLRS